jgi:hypothetical protein
MVDRRTSEVGRHQKHLICGAAVRSVNENDLRKSSDFCYGNSSVEWKELSGYMKSVVSIRFNVYELTVEVIVKFGMAIGYKNWCKITSQ